MAEFPALPLWTDAYLSDTGHLTTLEHGAYLLLLMTMWRNDGSLPADDKRLAKICRLTSPQWARIRDTIAEFFTVEDDRWTQGRLTDELGLVRQHSRRQSDKARSRWLKNKDKGDAVAKPKASRSDAPLPTTEDSSLHSESLRSRLKIGETELRSVLDDVHARAVVDHRQKKKAPLTAHAASLLAKAFGQCPDPNGAADVMIMQGWQGFKPEWLNRPDVQRSMRSSRPPSAAELATDLLREMEQADERNAEAERNHPPVGQHAITGPR